MLVRVHVLKNAGRERDGKHRTKTRGKTPWLVTGRAERQKWLEPGVNIQ